MSGSQVPELVELGIGITTSYTSSYEVRALITLDTLRFAQQAGIPVVVVDYNSPTELLKQFRELGAKVYPQKGKGLGASRREAIAHVMKIAKIVALIEAEKDALVKFLWGLAAPIIAGSCDLVSPGRLSLSTLTEIQRNCETAGNDYVNQITSDTLGENVDWWFGPVLGNHAAMQFLLDYDDRFGGKWEAHIVPRFLAVIGGLRHISMLVDFAYRDDQRDDETDNPEMDAKRIYQREFVMAAFAAMAEELNLPVPYPVAAPAS